MKKFGIRMAVVAMAVLFLSGCDLLFGGLFGGDGFEPNDSSASASSISIGSPQFHTLQPVGDTDWVSFSVTAGSSYLVETAPGNGGNVDTVLAVYNSGLSQIGRNDDGGSGLYSRLSFTASTGGTYFARVTPFGSSGTGSYSITVTRTSTGSSGSNDTAAGAQLIIVGDTFSGSISPSGDVDWLRFSASAGTTYVIETRSRSSDTVDTVLELYDTDGSTLLERNDDSGSGLYSRIVAGPSLIDTSGTYYIRIRGFGNTSTGDYEASVTIQ
jgi:hypothetical protein